MKQREGAALSEGMMGEKRGLPVNVSGNHSHLTQRRLISSDPNVTEVKKAYKLMIIIVNLVIKTVNLMLGAH